MHGPRQLMLTREAACSTLPPRCTTRLGVWSIDADVATNCRLKQTMKTMSAASHSNDQSKQHRLEDFCFDGERLSWLGHAHDNQISCMMTPPCSNKELRHPISCSIWLRRSGAMRFPTGIPVIAIAVANLRRFPNRV